MNFNCGDQQDQIITIAAIVFDDFVGVHECNLLFGLKWLLETQIKEEKKIHMYKKNWKKKMVKRKGKK